MAEAFIWYEITKGFTMRQIEGLSKRSWGLDYVKIFT